MCTWYISLKYVIPPLVRVLCAWWGGGAFWSLVRVLCAWGGGGGGGGGGLVDTRPLTNLPAMSPCCWPHCEFPSANRKSQGGICEGKGNLRGKEKQHNDKLSFNKAIELELQPLLCWERILRKTDNYHRTTMSCIQEKYAIASKANKLLGYVRD